MHTVCCPIKLMSRPTLSAVHAILNVLCEVKSTPNVSVCLHAGILATKPFVLFAYNLVYDFCYRVP